MLSLFLIKITTKRGSNELKLPTNLSLGCLIRSHLGASRLLNPGLLAAPSCSPEKPNSIPGITNTSFLFCKCFFPSCTGTSDASRSEAHSGDTAAVVVPVLFLLLLAVCGGLVVLYLRHRRLQNNFTAFANSHYNSRLGSAIFSSGDELGNYFLSIRETRHELENEVFYKGRLHFRLAEGYMFLIICHEVSPFCSVWHDL